jgi:xanthine/uracil permease
VIVLIAENTGHIKAVASMTGRNLDRSLGRGYMADGLATMLAGLGGGSGTTTYAENIGVMAATKVYSTSAYYIAAIVAIAFGCIPKFGALISTLPAGVLGGAGTILYGLIAVLGGRIWVENRVNFSNPVNLIPCAIGLVAGAGNYTLIFDHGNVSFNGIAMGAFGVIIAYQLMRWLSKYGVFHDGQPSLFASVVPTAQPAEGPVAEATELPTGA